MFLKTLAHFPSSLSEAAASGLPGAELAAAKRHVASRHRSMVTEEASGRLDSTVDR